ncbi:MAG TPA: prepilin-type N-terminal cleavage/methylation domain-containing protein [Gemmatimonadales bacterium]|nr:prepilin-type N-terminal cleavage/methylation domain-containing protein [Gemmatimonadales bacterium]
MKRRAGFTLLEVLVALVVLTLGLLGLIAQTASLVRALARVRRAETITTAAAARLEQLRASGCVARADGAEVVRQGSIIAGIDWRWSAAADSSPRVQLVVTPRATPLPALPPETLTMVLPCR